MAVSTPTTNHPLSWPPGRPRTPPAQRRNAKFDRSRSFGATLSGMLSELERFGAMNVVLSTNLKPRFEGMPRGAEPTDPGVAVYFAREQRTYCIATDVYARVDENLRAIALTVEAMRAIERHGAGQMVEAALTGFRALPASASSMEPYWWQVLNVDVLCPLETAQAAYRQLAAQTHPDKQGGDRERFERVQAAWEQAQKARPTS